MRRYVLTFSGTTLFLFALLLLWSTPTLAQADGADLTLSSGNIANTNQVNGSLSGNVANTNQVNAAPSTNSVTTNQNPETTSGNIANTNQVNGSSSGNIANTNQVNGSNGSNSGN